MHLIYGYELQVQSGVFLFRQCMMHLTYGYELQVVNNPHAFDNYILQGMTVFFNTYGKLINLNVLKKKLKCITPEIIKAEADSYPSNFLKKRCNRYAYAIFNLYNKGIRNGKLEDFVALCKR